MRYICHPELRNGIGAWNFKGEEGNTQGNKAQIFGNWMFALPYRWAI